MEDEIIPYIDGEDEIRSTSSPDSARENIRSEDVDEHDSSKYALDVPDSDDTNNNGMDADSLQPTPETPAETNPEQNRYGWSDFVVNLISFVTIGVVIGSDIGLAMLYYRQGDWWGFGLTLFCIIVPCLVITAVSLVWYYKDLQHHRYTKLQWAVRLLGHVLLIGPFSRYIHPMYYGLKSRPNRNSTNNPQDEDARKRWYDLMLHANTRAFHLWIIGGCLEVVPQILLIIFRNDRTSTVVRPILLLFRFVMSLFFIVWLPVAYYQRHTLDNRSEDVDVPDSNDNEGISSNNGMDADPLQHTPETPAETHLGQHHHGRVRYGYFDIFVSEFSALTYFADIGTDVILAAGYYFQGDLWWFVLTLFFIIVPSLVITTFSLVLYYRHYKSYTKLEWTGILLLHVLLLIPVWRYLDTIRYGVRSGLPINSKNPQDARKRQYDRMLHGNTDACMLRLVECCLEAAPQLVLQLYIMTTFGNEKTATVFILQVVSCSFSLLSLAWAPVAYRRAQRSLDKSIVRPVCGLNVEWLRMIGRMVLELFSHMFIVAARVLSLALFASRFRFWVVLVCVVHFVITLVWQIIVSCRQGETQERRHQGNIKELALKAGMAALHIICDLDLPAGYTRRRYAFYYCIVYIENTIMILMWFTHTYETTLLTVLALVVVRVSFLIGAALKVTYYDVYNDV